MPKAVTIPALNLSDSKSAASSPHIGDASARSPESPKSPRSPPLSPALGSNASGFILQIRPEHVPVSPRMGAFADPPSSPGRVSPKQHSRDASKSFFSNLMATKSSNKLQTHAQSPDPSIADSSEKPSGRSRGNSKDRSLHTIRKQTSTPDLPKIMTANGRHDENTDLRPPASADGGIQKQKGKSKLGGILTRSRSGRPEEEKKPKQRTPTHLNIDVQPPLDSHGEPYAAPLKTAPIKNSFRDQMQMAEGSAIRNRSADRTGHDDTRHNGYHAPSHPPSSRDGPSLLASFQQTGRGVGDRLGKAGRGLFNKIARSGSTTERELIPDEHYICTTISLPLVKQTRKTRIAKKLESSNDKTEYWMPALPWRCIDYLNMQCEQEGLYRVPGSGRDVKFWQRRFDTEYDINLFEEPELYDVNTIASMFKAWLRDLPEELFPKATQARISKECHGSQKTPQLLKDELSKLPPFNYYLLFAITCHLSLLHSYSDQNKMDYRNLCICFQPCLKIDAFCFQFLVIDWKECWQQGCWTEKEFLAEEIRFEREGPAHEDHGAIAVEESVENLNNNRTALPPTKEQQADGQRNMEIVNGHSRTQTPSTQQTQQQQQLQNTPQQTTPQQQSQQQHTPQSSTPSLKPKQRSLSASGQNRVREPSHGHAQTAPAIPRLITSSPEQASSEPQKLPELGSMSPIRM